MSICRNCGGAVIQPDCTEIPDNPCGCQEPTRTTYCDRDTKDNVWMERDPNTPNAPGICMLDTMSEGQVINSIQRSCRARVDLLRVTSDPNLLYLARTVPTLPTTEEADDDQKRLNRDADSIPFYTQFRGQPPFNQ
jgi:hypothetical protein